MNTNNTLLSPTAPAPEMTVAQVIVQQKNIAQARAASQQALPESEKLTQATVPQVVNPILDADTLLIDVPAPGTSLDSSLAAQQEPGKENTLAATAAVSSPAVAEPSFFAQRPIMQVESALPPSGSSKLFGVLAYAPYIPLIALVLLQTIFTLDARDLWYSDEIRHADAFRNLLEGGKWLVLETSRSNTWFAAIV